MNNQLVHSRYFNRAIKSFSSLAACLDYVSDNFPLNQRTTLLCKSIDTGEWVSKDVPKFLFRGESHAFPTTIPSMDRLLKTKSIPLITRNILKSQSERVDNELQKFLSPNSMLSAGFLQHYGMPTGLLDVTSDLDIAAYFASGGEVGESGLFCVLPVDVVAQHSTIIDLTQHPYAERPRRQSAYALWHRTHSDIKNVDCINNLDLQWFEFTLKLADVELFRSRQDILDAHTDKVAGILQLILEGYGKIDDIAARWLADRVATAPFVAKVIDYWDDAKKHPRTIELVSCEEIGLSYDETRERENNYKKWSIAHPGCASINLSQHTIT